MVYDWKKGNRIFADAQKVGEELEKIENKEAPKVVQIARKNKNSELYKCFEWDDSIAGELHRIEQARQIMRTLVVTIAGADEKGNSVSVVVRALESVRLDGEDEDNRIMTYKPVMEVMSDPELKQQVMNRLSSTVMEAENMARDYSYLDKIFQKAHTKLKKVHETIFA